MSNEKKVVGRLIGNIMDLAKKDIPNKSEPMKEINKDQMRSMWSKKESEIVPLQVTLMNDDIPLSDIDCTLSQEEVEVGNGITNNDGLVIWNEPRVMMMNMRMGVPSTIKYDIDDEEVSIGICIPEDSTYVNATITSPNEMIIDTDGVVNIHEYTSSIFREANCTEVGIKRYICENCNNTYDEEIPIDHNNHEYDDTDHCIRCGILNPNHVHDYQMEITTEATHTENGLKTYTCRCGESYTEQIPLLGHTYNEGVITKQPTCTEKGIKTYTCIGSDDSYTEEIPALGHNFSSEYTIDKEATTTAEGSKSRHCTRCDAKTDITIIPKLPDNIGSEDELFQWQTSRNEVDGSVTLITPTTSIAKNIIIYPFYMFMGKTYKTKLPDDCTNWLSSVKGGSHINSITFKQEIDTSNVTSMMHMFSYNDELTTINGLEYLDTSNVTDMSNMFMYCSKLINMFLSSTITGDNYPNIVETSFNTSKVTTMDSMFSGCRSLKGLDLRYFAIKFNTYLGYMFESCSNLEIVLVSSSNWLKNIEDEGMFDGCKCSHVTFA